MSPCYFFGTRPVAGGSAVFPGLLNDGRDVSIPERGTAGAGHILDGPSLGRRPEQSSFVALRQSGTSANQPRVRYASDSDSLYCKH